ncbi:hypothetical protein L228DRAFT_244946 [Xylona heveae TC161]|uniref:Uncharacterized protein n=1 Tax=Xylona heveae (strain CBS 132557 / TC161) TaxID=1328760 RepID=A0A165HXR3_XYLHT|nr:hypothetical protein L228DRAFT_244946 [Xylona heveae TC161]KZF24073.1 hypothetical protein L228DRAFT_244946 [Xylona heveae TC161]
MSGFKDLAKHGWHPKGAGAGGKESWRGDFKGINQVAGWMGKGKSPTEEGQQHVSQPLSSLKDPALFPPPPKHINYHGAAAAPNTLTPDRSGIGAPLPQSQIQEQREAEQAAAQAAIEEEQRPPSPPKPYRVDTTGLTTNHLPKPPVRRINPNQSSPVPTPPRSPVKPSLPPRLPPRQNSHPGPSAPSPPPTYNDAVQEPGPAQGYLNQSSLNRLGQAGISVPGLEIGHRASPPLPQRSGSASPARSADPPAPAPATRNPHLSELNSRFAKLSASPSTGSTGTTSAASSQGTSFAQKQSAFNTANSFRKDPSSVSIADARNAASTANNFRERHGSQVASGWKAANDLNNKYGAMDRLNSYGSGTSASPAAAHSPVTTPSTTGPQAPQLASKKKPPPPPPKKKTLGGLPQEHDQSFAPPPIPHASKPRP